MRGKILFTWILKSIRSCTPPMLPLKDEATLKVQAYCSTTKNCPRTAEQAAYLSFLITVGEKNTLLLKLSIYETIF